MFLIYEHQHCPKRADGICPGHRRIRTQRSLARIANLRDAGNLAYLGGGPRPQWLRF